MFYKITGDAVWGRDGKAPHGRQVDQQTGGLCVVVYTLRVKRLKEEKQDVLRA